jgi:UDP-GlcNAc:undecaprenyl-phosphate GlcNAc-1-phosphate transferase
MNYINIIIIFSVAFITAFLFTPMVKKLAFKLNAVDIPNDDRRVHNHPIPRLGGIAILLGFIIALLVDIVISISTNAIIFDNKLTGLILGIIIIEIAGVWDDIKPIGAWTKLSFQIAAAFVVISGGVKIEFLTNPFVENGVFSLGIFAIPLTIIWIVGVTNALNFIDGLDGLAAGIASISSLSLLFISIFLKNFDVVILTAALAGSTLGFLPFNFNPAKIFMGETGSGFLGFTLGTISIMGMIKSYTAIAIVTPLIVLGLPIFDTIFAIVRRIIHGKSPMSADRGHLHHRMVDAGFTQKQTVLILYIISAFLGLIGLMIVENGMWKVILLVAAIVFFIFAGQKIMIDINNKGE